MLPWHTQPSTPRRNTPAAIIRAGANPLRSAATTRARARRPWPRPHRPGPRGLRRLGRAHGATAPAPGRPATPRPATARAQSTRAPGGPVPETFLGLSFESADLHLLARSAQRGNLAALLRSIAPTGVLRIGGTTVDTATAWTTDGARRPAWAAATVTSQDLAALGRLTAATGWDVLLTLNLGHYDPRAAAAETAAAQAALGPHLLGVEIGNEPERFVEHGVRSTGWDSRRYRHQVDEYRRALPGGVALAGPDAVSLQGSLGWVDREAAWQHPSLLTAHYYPLGRCGAYVPTINALLSPTVRQAETQTLQLADRVQRVTRTPLRIDESNNVACGGQPGVSDRFAAALWATDYLGRAMASQVTGINLHGLLSNPDGYAPIAFRSAAARAAGQLSVNPEFYALLLTSHLLGDRPVPAAARPRLPPPACACSAAPTAAWTCSRSTRARPHRCCGCPCRRPSTTRASGACARPR